MYKVVVVTIFIFFLNGCSKVINRCEQLVSLANNSKAIHESKKLLLKLEEAPFLARHFEKSLGFVYIKDLKEDIGIDWSVFDIPLQKLTFSLNGRDLDYLNLNFEKVDSLSIGYGHRQHIVVNISGKKFFGIEGLEQFSEQVIRIDDEFSVICR